MKKDIKNNVITTKKETTKVANNKSSAKKPAAKKETGKKSVTANKFVIISDSCCDLDAQKLKKLDVDYVRMMLNYNEKEEPFNLEWNNFSPKEFYNMMRNGIRFRTSMINPEAYIEKFEPYLKKGFDILSLTCSSALSGSVNSSRTARETLLKKYPKAKIFCIDSLRGSLGLGLLAEYASNMRKAGKSIDETAEWVENNKLNIHQIGTVDDMIYLKRAGRVTGSKALICGIMNIKPLIISNAEGFNETVGKVIGRKKSLREIVNFVKNNIIAPEKQTVFIVHADCIDEANQLKAKIIDAVKCKDVYINYVGPIIGATVGPGMIGVYFHGKKIEKK